MVEHQFYKTASATMLESTKKAFASLPPVTKLRMNRFELPINSIRRVLGDNFYDMSKSDFDICKLVINDKASFTFEALEHDYERATDITQMVAYLFQQFAILNAGESTFTPEFMGTKFLEVAVTTTSGVNKSMLSMNDLASVASFNDSNQIIGIRYIREITECSAKIQQNDMAYQKMVQSNNTHAIEKLNEEREQLVAKLNEYNNSIIKNFLEIIKKASGIEDTKEIYDVMFIFDESIPDNDPKSNSTVRVKAVFTLHDVAVLNVIALENKFHVKHDIVNSEDFTE